MKTLYLNIIFFLTFTCSFSCKAQQNVLPLNTWMKNIPQGGYVKDLNNELSPYIGVYKTHHEGSEITLFITKEDNRPTKVNSKQFYQDALVIKYIVKNPNNQVLQDTQNGITLLNNIISLGTNPNLDSVVFYYEGTNCRVGWGKILLKKLSATQISWTYRANSTVITEQNCPGNPDRTIYLPETEGLIFTKQ